jgi:hypothetical protein
MIPTELEKYKIYAGDNEQKIDAKVAEKALEILSSSPYGKSVIAAQTKGEIKRELYYEGRARKLFDTYVLTQGEEAVFDADLDVSAVAISVEGLPEMTEVKSDRLRIDTAPVTSLFIVRWNESNLRKFDVLEVARKRGLASVQLREDIKAYTLLKYASGLTNQNPVRSLAGTTAADNNPSVVAEVNHKLTPISIATAMGELRGKLLPASVIWVNPKRLTDLLLFNVAITNLNQVGATATGGYGIFAPAVQEEVWKTGLMGEIFGVPTYDSVVLPTEEAYVLAPKEYLGKLAIRTDVQVKTLADPKFFGDVYMIYEDIGFVVRFVKGIVQINIS